MLPTAILAAAVAFAPLFQKPGADEYATKTDAGITLRFTSTMLPQDADAFLGTLKTAREIVHTGLGVALPFDPIVRVSEKAGSHRAYFTDGEDKIFFDFPSSQYFSRLQFSDERILRYAIPAFVQLWLYRSLSSTAGLDPRVVDSLTEYVKYLYDDNMAQMQKTKVPDPPIGPGQTWYQLESIYPKTLTFIMNALSSRKTPAHLLGAAFREIAFSATEDEKVKELFDRITPPEPLLSATELTPSGPMDPTSALRTGRLALFTNSPLLDVIGDPIPLADRRYDFENIFEMATRIEPDPSLRREPAAIHGMDLWRLYFEFAPRIAKSSDNLDYYMVLREFLARFEDRALSIVQTPAMRQPPGTPYWISVFGLGFTRIGDRIFVKKVTEGTEPAKAGLKPGLEVLTIDGRPAMRTLDLLTSCVKIFDSCPSRQRAEAFALDALLAGAPDSEAVVTLRDQDAATAPVVTIRFKRFRPPTPPQNKATVDFELRDDGVGVITVRQFVGDALQRFAADLDALAKKGAKALVVDVRGNEGIRDPRAGAPLSLAALARLLPAEQGKIVLGSEIERSKDRFEEVKPTELVLQPVPGATPFSLPIAVLTDSWTGGEAEVFAHGMQVSKRGMLVGQKTAGSVTSVKARESWQSLTRSRIELSFGQTAIVRPDGKPLQSVGVLPQIVAEHDPADLKAGKDTVLERAVKSLLEQLGAPAKEHSSH